MFKIPSRYTTVPSEEKLQNMLWYVLHVGVPKNLLVVESSLKKSGAVEYALWLPVYQEYTRLRNHMLLVDQLIYPGYVFIGVRDSKHILQVRSSIKSETVGECDVLGDTDTPITEEELRQVINVFNGYHSPNRPITGVKPGDHVVIAFGPLSGFPAEVKAIRSNGKVSLLAFFLNREITVETSIVDVISSEE